MFWFKILFCLYFSLLVLKKRENHWKTMKEKESDLLTRFHEQKGQILCQCVPLDEKCY